MTDRKALIDPKETPEDVASLYSWANLHGAKYRDFSASRAQVREQARLQAAQAAQLEEEQARLRAAQEQAEQARRAAEEQIRLAEIAAQQAAATIARQSAQTAGQQFAGSQAPVQPAPLGVPQVARPLHETAPQMPQAPRPDRLNAPAPFSQPGFPTSQPLRPAAAPAHFAPLREEPLQAPPASWAAPETSENPMRPAWLAARPQATARPQVTAQPSAMQAPEDTIQGSRDRLTSRWFALRGVFDAGSVPAAETQSAPIPSRAPVLGVFSLAGGVGKTSLVATLGRALSARGERVLLVDTAAFGLLPFFFGARDQRPGQLRTFAPPAASGDAPVQMVTVDPDGFGPENGGPEGLSAEIGKYSYGTGRVIVDLATASGSTTRRVLKLQPLILVPVVPDMNSVVSVSSIDAFFERNAASAGNSALPYYVLNQFDPSLPLHLDVREILREQLGERLLPFALRRSPAVSEALAEGMTVMDYAPNSTVAEDFGSLAGWVKTLSAPAGNGFRGVRWSER